MPSALGIRVSVFTVFQVITDVSGECMGEDVSVQWCKALLLLNVPLVIHVTACACIELFQFDS